MGIVLLLVPLVRRYAGNAAAILAAGIWMLQPAPIFAGPYWGQVDAVGTVPFLAALLAAGARGWSLARLLAGLAAITQPPFRLPLLRAPAAALLRTARSPDPPP